MSTKKNNTSQPAQGLRKKGLPAKDSQSIGLIPEVIKGKKVKSNSGSTENDKRKPILLAP